MSGAGTGYPLRFMCFRERRARDWRGNNQWLESKHATIVRTGRTRKAPRPGKGHPRKLSESHEYRCQCGYVGWSSHVDVLNCPRDDP